MGSTGIADFEHSMFFNDVSPVALLIASADNTKSNLFRTLVTTGLIRGIQGIPVQDRGSNYFDMLSVAQALLANIRRVVYGKEPHPILSNRIDSLANFTKSMPVIESDLIQIRHVDAMINNRPETVAETLDTIMPLGKSALIIGLDPMTSTDIFIHLPTPQNALTTEDVQPVVSKHKIYPVRFSNTLMGDQEPLLSEGEKRSLEYLGLGRTAVIIDESRISGATQELAGEYFAILFGRTVISLSIFNDNYHRLSSMFMPRYIEHN